MSQKYGKADPLRDQGTQRLCFQVLPMLAHLHQLFRWQLKQQSDTDDQHKQDQIPVF